MLKGIVIISGGQSGVDRAALDVAIARGVAYAGWCPRGGWAEDFAEPPGLLARYPLLRETPLADPAQRTQWNVRDAVLIIADKTGIEISRGTQLAHAQASRYRKPIWTANIADDGAVAGTAAWLAELLDEHVLDSPFRLGIGGPRESRRPASTAMPCNS